MGKLAAPHPRRGLSLMNSNALCQIENLASAEKASRLSIFENLESIFWGSKFIANSLKPKGKTFVLAATNKVINKINRRNNQIDTDAFRNIKDDKNRLNNPTRENVK